ncbi:MAG: hypothetical protein JST26_02085 [Bacteroidetes bacterium]|nr:hypothetical protein [Bacteroidota bacterium]
MKKIILFALATLIIFSFGSCRKNQMGGKASVKGRVLHHSLPIPNAYIYIKFNATEFPGDDYTKYDTYVKSDSEGNYVIDNFYKGNYYLYAMGYDYTIAAPYLVKGGLSVSVRNKEHLNKDIAVTEGD